MKKVLRNSMLLAGMLAMSINANAQVYANTDMTSQFESLTEVGSWTGASGYTATNFCPAVTTNSGKTVQMIERYDINCNKTGNVFNATVTGLPAGTYTIELYGGAAYTFGRGFDSEAFSTGTWNAGDKIESNTGVTLYAKASGVTYGGEIPIYYATNFPDGAATVTMEGVQVGTDGTVQIGMDKESQSTNWHIIQLKGVTAQVDVLEILQNEITKAKKLLESFSSASGSALSTLSSAITTAEGYLTSTDANAIQEATKALKEAEAKFFEDIRFAYNGVAYIMDPETGLYVAAGHSWGTQGIVNEAGLDLTFIGDPTNNTVQIETGIRNSETNHFLGSNLFMDSSAFDWSLIDVGNGYLLSNGSQYVGIDADNNLVLSAEQHVWKIVDAETVYSQRLNALNEATQSAPVDATFLLQNPNFNRNDQRVNSWTVSSDCTNWNLNGGNNVNNCAESYHSTFTISQAIADAPAGLYELTAQGFYRQDGDVTEDEPYFFINGATAAVPVKEGTENNMGEASESFTNGLYTISPIQYNHTGGELTVGVVGTATSQWVIFDNFTLKYFGAETTGINTVESSNAQSSAIFNLAGQQVKNATRGLYIQNGKKYVVK